MSERRSAADARRLAPENFKDPYDAMTDDEFDDYVDRLFSQSQGPTRSITVRMPEELLSRLQRIAAKRHIPYQRLMKRMLEESVAGLERRGAAPKSASSRRRTKAR